MKFTQRLAAAAASIAIAGGLALTTAAPAHADRGVLQVWTQYGCSIEPNPNVGCIAVAIAKRDQLVAAGYQVYSANAYPLKAGPSGGAPGYAEVRYH